MCKDRLAHLLVLPIGLLMMVTSALAAEVNPFTGTEQSIAQLKARLEVARLESLIANEVANKRRIESESKKAPEAKPTAPGFRTLSFPSDPLPQMPQPLGGKKVSKPDVSGTPAVAIQPSVHVPAVPAGPRLVGVINDSDGRVAVIELGGVLKQAREGEVAHGLTVSKIDVGWAEVGGKRLYQDNSGLVLVTNVDRQPTARVTGAASTPVASAASMPGLQPTAFMPPGLSQ